MVRCLNCHKRFYEECTTREHCPTDKEINIAFAITHKYVNHGIKFKVGSYACSALNLKNDIIEALIKNRQQF